jgi:hypothetical protein
MSKKLANLVSQIQSGNLGEIESLSPQESEEVEGGAIDVDFGCKTNTGCGPNTGCGKSAAEVS